MGGEAKHVVAEVLKVKLVPVYTVATLVLDSIHHLRIGYMPSTRPFGAYVGIVFAVDVEGKGKVEVELLLLKGITQLEARLQHLVVAEVVVAANIKTIGKAALRTVTEVERIEQRTYTEVSLVS